jgi:hypothetical protein
MKRVIFVLALLAIATTGAAFAQIQGGTISGTVRDEQGGVLPGVTVTAQGVDATQTFVTEATGEYRFLNLAPGPYKITAALQGFTTMVRDNVIVAVGRNVELPLALKIASVAETITVNGDSPVIDIKATGTSTNFTSDELTRIPTSRDPFALMRSVPGVLVDRVNIGGNETGQQSNFASKGTRPQDAVWTMDGINITDMTATGASPSYYNYDNFEEIQVSTAGQDIKQPTGGMGLNLVVKRGTNQFHGGFRGYFDNESMESSNVPAELAATGTTHATSDHNKQISDYGYDIGGPDPPRPRLVLQLVLDPGRAARPARRRAGRPDAAEESRREVELAGDQEGHGQFPVLRRVQDQGRPQSRHLGDPVRRADRDVPPGQHLHR